MIVDFFGTTSPADQHAGVGQTKKSVIEDALQHWSVDLEVSGQILGADGCSTDEHCQALTHGQRLEQLPGGGRNFLTVAVLNIVQNNHVSLEKVNEHGFCCFSGLQLRRSSKNQQVPSQSSSTVLTEQLEKRDEIQEDPVSSELHSSFKEKDTATVRP